MKKNQRALSLLIMLAMMTIACQTATNIIATPTPTFTPSATSTPTRTPRPTRTSTPTATPLVIEKDSVHKMVSGGYNYITLKDFDKQVNNHEIFMSSPDESLSILLSARTSFPGESVKASLKDYMNYVTDQFDNVIEEERANITHAGADGVTALFTGVDGGKAFKARATFLRPDGGKVLMILVYAYGEGTWDAFGDPAYQKLLEGVSFFKITVWDGCPVATRPTYGTTKETPIKIGGALINGANLTEDYLSALLGKNGELVSYYRVGTVDGGSVVLDEFKINYGNTTRTLYIDVYNREAPRAPTGMSCSEPFPQQ